MNGFCKRFACFSAVLLAAVALSGRADEQEKKLPAAPRSMLELKKHGTVEVEKDAAGKVTAIKLIVTSYNVTLDEGSKPLESMDGQKVKVLATYKKVEDEGWLTVTSVEPFTAAEKPAETAPVPPAEPAGKKPAEAQKEPAPQVIQIPAAKSEEKSAEKAPAPAPEPAPAQPAAPAEKPAAPAK